MEKKKSKSFWRSLFSTKASSSCCDIQFEEVPEEKSEDEKKAENSEKDMVDNDEMSRSNKQKPSCGCN